MGDFLKLPRPATEAKPTGQDREMCEFARRYPCLHEWLTLEVWDNGAAREPATLLLFLDGSRPKLCLHDREGSQVAFVAAWTFGDALQALEDGLLANSLDWRPSRRENGRGRRN